MPMVVYREGTSERYQSSAFMGDMSRAAFDPSSTESPYEGGYCFRIRIEPGDTWVGLGWVEPANDWGDTPGGYDLTGANRLTFAARGTAGGLYGHRNGRRRHPGRAQPWGRRLGRTSAWRDGGLGGRASPRSARSPGGRPIEGLPCGRRRRRRRHAVVLRTRRRRRQRHPREGGHERRLPEGPQDVHGSHFAGLGCPVPTSAESVEVFTPSRRINVS